MQISRRAGPPWAGKLVEVLRYLQTFEGNHRHLQMEADASQCRADAADIEPVCSQNTADIEPVCSQNTADIESAAPFCAAAAAAAKLGFLPPPAPAACIAIGRSVSAGAC